MAKRYYVYIMTNKNNTTLYTGITNDLERRVHQYKTGQGGWFTKKYALEKLVWFEGTTDARSAIAREKQIKGDSRRSKGRLIENLIPEWKDLSEVL